MSVMCGRMGCPADEDGSAMSRDRDPFQIPRAGLEAAPLAGLVSIPLPGRTVPLPSGRLVAESTLGAVVVYGIYQALLSALRCEALVRRGELDRQAQVRIVSRSAWAAMQQGAAIGVVLSLVVLVLPWLSLPLGLLSVVGVGRASLDLAHAFWDGLSPLQRHDLHRAAYAAGVSLHRLLGGGRLAAGSL
jgi:hypothetical protein